MRVVWGFVVALVLVAFVGAQSVAAHAVLLKVSPSSSQTLDQAPTQVQLLFSEPLDPVFSAVNVTNAAGAIIDSGDSHVDPDNNRLLVASLPAALPDGVYTVFWRSLSAIDVHPDAGRYSLFVRVPVTADATLISTKATITATPETTFGRWWFAVAASLFGGVLCAWKLVLGPVLQGEESAELYTSVRRRAYRMTVLGGVLLILGTLFAAVAQAAAAAHVPLGDAFGKPVADLLLRGRFASIWWPRLGLEIASLLLIAIGGIEGLSAECALATLPAVLLTSALTSHGAALQGAAMSGVAIDWLHIVGATVWVGGLIAMLVCVASMRNIQGSGTYMRRLVSRFGRLALVASMAVLLSGVLQGALELGSWTALVDSLYGQLILVKVAFLLVMLALAAFNEVQARRVADSALGLRAGVRFELGVGLLVLAVAAMLSGTPPSASAS